MDGFANCRAACVPVAFQALDVQSDQLSSQSSAISVMLQQLLARRMSSGSSWCSSGACVTSLWVRTACDMSQGKSCEAVYIFTAMHVDAAFSYLLLSLLLICLTYLMTEYNPVTVSQKNHEQKQKIHCFLITQISC